MLSRRGTSGIDIDLRRVDIDQCPTPKGSPQLNIFAASDKCKGKTTECVPLTGLGFRRGSYKCVCKRGFYFPEVKAEHRYYNGIVIEEEYEKLIMVMRASSPLLLRVVVSGAFLIYCTTIVMYPKPTVYSCTARIWLREIGFCLVYGALMLKTWRVSMIFRVRSAKTIKITDVNLLNRLAIIVGLFTVLLVVRTFVSPPSVIVGHTADGLKAHLCSTDWWDYGFSILEVMFLVWGIRLCIVVRKAPSEFNESRFISMAIYNEFLLSVFLNISMLFLQRPANPDLLYIIFFCHTHLTVTLLLALIFGTKAYVVFKGQDKANESFGMVTKPYTAKFITKPRPGTSQQAASDPSTAATGYLNFTEEEIQEEFQRVYLQLGYLKDRNMRFGNRHLVSKISAMQNAANRLDREFGGSGKKLSICARIRRCLRFGRLCKFREYKKSAKSGAINERFALHDSPIYEEDETAFVTADHHGQRVFFVPTARLSSSNVTTMQRPENIEEFEPQPCSSRDVTIEMTSHVDVSSSSSNSHSSRQPISGHAKTHSIKISEVSLINSLVLCFKPGAFTTSRKRLYYKQAINGVKNPGKIHVVIDSHSI
ncbi:hypothetical protein Trydic_g15431 [Trypoxylus dichotomus]